MLVKALSCPTHEKTRLSQDSRCGRRGGSLVGQQTQSFLGTTGLQDIAKTDFTLKIAPVTVELAPNRILSTIGYNGTFAGAGGCA